MAEYGSEMRQVCARWFRELVRQRPLPFGACGKAMMAVAWFAFKIGFLSGAAFQLDRCERLFPVVAFAGRRRLRQESPAARSSQAGAADAAIPAGDD